MRSASRLDRYDRVLSLAPSVHLYPQSARPGSARNLKNRREQMNTLFLKFYLKLQDLARSEEGQDLVEYALLVSLIALSAITGISHIASAVTTVFSNISASLA
jgi:pilus assembly protein Flp/PilA